jgi:hypothetical protein
MFRAKQVDKVVFLQKRERGHEDLSHLFKYTHQGVASEVIPDVIFALTIPLDGVLDSLFRARPQDLLPEKANLPHESNAIRRGARQ